MAKLDGRSWLAASGVLSGVLISLTNWLSYGAKVEAWSSFLEFSVLLALRRPRVLSAPSDEGFATMLTSSVTKYSHKSVRARVRGVN